MSLDALNQELGRLCSIPQEKRSENDTARIVEIEAMIDYLTSWRD